MPFLRPTLQDLITRVEGDLKSGLGLVTLLRRSFLKVIARVMAGLSHLLFGYLTYVEKQAFVDTADDPDVIARWGNIWGVPQKLATFSNFIASVTGTNGTVIPVNTVYRRADGVEFETDAEVTLTGSGDTISLTAILAGAAATVEVSDVIPILTPIAGLNSNSTVSEVIIIPEDTEDIEAYRIRILDRIRNPPSGGAAHDYIQWALQVAGITRAWVGPQALGPGTVVVYVISDGTDPITPDTPKLNEVALYIEGLRPVTANVSIVAPILAPLAMTIKIKPNTTAIQNAIIAELQDLLLREAAIAGSYQSPGVLNDGKILLSHIDEAVAVALDLQDHLITVINGSDPADITPSTGQLITLGTITWLPLA